MLFVFETLMSKEALHPPGGHRPQHQRVRWSCQTLNISLNLPSTRPSRTPFTYRQVQRPRRLWRKVPGPRRLPSPPGGLLSSGWCRTLGPVPLESCTFFSAPLTVGCLHLTHRRESRQDFTSYGYFLSLPHPLVPTRASLRLLRPLLSLPGVKHHSNWDTLANKLMFLFSREKSFLTF